MKKLAKKVITIGLLASVAVGAWANAISVPFHLDAGQSLNVPVSLSLSSVLVVVQNNPGIRSDLNGPITITGKGINCNDGKPIPAYGACVFDQGYGTSPASTGFTIKAEQPASGDIYFQLKK